MKPRSERLEDTGNSWDEECRLWKRHDYIASPKKATIPEHISTSDLASNLRCSPTRHIHSCIDFVPCLIPSRTSLRCSEYSDTFPSRLDLSRLLQRLYITSDHPTHSIDVNLQMLQTRKCRNDRSVPILVQPSC